MTNQDSDSETNDAPLQSDEQQTSEEGKDQNDLHPRIQQLTKKMHELEESKDSEIQRLSSQLDDLREEISARQERTGDDDFTADEDQALEKIARGLKRKNILVTHDDLRAERLSLDYTRLSEKHDGSDGYPKFIPTDVQTFAKRRGIENLEDAWYLMHRTAISQVDTRKASKTPTVIESEKPTGKIQDEPKGDVITPESIAKMTDDEWEANRDKILSSMKARPPLQ